MNNLTVALIPVTGLAFFFVGYYIARSHFRDREYENGYNDAWAESYKYHSEHFNYYSQRNQINHGLEIIDEVMECEDMDEVKDLCHEIEQDLMKAERELDGEEILKTALNDRR
jgi:hypothetical protein